MLKLIISILGVNPIKYNNGNNKGNGCLKPRWIYLSIKSNINLKIVQIQRFFPIVLYYNIYSFNKYI